MRPSTLATTIQTGVPSAYQDTVVVALLVVAVPVALASVSSLNPETSVVPVGPFCPSTIVATFPLGLVVRMCLPG